MKVYVINLARRPERMRFMQEQLDRTGVAYERVDAVDGARLSGSECKSLVRRFRWWCARGYMPRAGEIGCAMSHRSVWRKMKDDEDRAFCVLEDDVSVSERFAEMLDKAESFAAESASPVAILLTPFCAEPQGGLAEGCFGRISWAALAGGYVLNCAAARRLLSATERLDSPIDEWARWAKRGGVQLYAAIPSVCSQSEYGSETFDSPFASDTLERDTVLVSDMKPTRRFFHKCLRLVGRTLDNMIP